MIILGSLICSKLNRQLTLAVVFVLLLGNFSIAQEDNQPPAGFTALFNGDNLSGWHGMGHFSPVKLAEMSEEDRKAKRDADWENAQQHWSVDNGELVNDGKGVYLTTDREYGDFEFWIDYKAVPKSDSGIYLRANPQVQIWDVKNEKQWKHGSQKGSGGLWNNKQPNNGRDPLVLADNPMGQWNRLRIQQVGARTNVWLNDKLVVDWAIMENFWDRKRAHFPTGPIQLQTHGGEIRWRNVFIKELDSMAANKMLSSHDNEGFKSIFNGTDFTGFSGQTDKYEITDGVLRNKPKQGGTIFTDKEYSDFVARLEFRLPKAGNNGLAIRYPGTGDPAYSGMTELQVLDSGHESYANLDPRQYHGSAYGMAAATRGYLRPVGEWNFQEVTVKGSTIKVELNGSVILDTDLSKLDPAKFKSGTKHPGKDLKKGHFGLAGHDDPVEYRNLSIKEL
ncbi:DUF1080 domain-containing protein [Mariniblastus sp.]|nr:DUF1080 domain-containing protein [Mariniblastus sp.]